MCDHNATVILPTPDWLWDLRAVPEDGVCVDACIAEQIAVAWERGVRTLGSCCGHGNEPASVVLARDGRLELARSVLPGWTLLQWQLVDVTTGG